MLNRAEAGSTVTAEELAELQEVCARHAAAGGELGEIAAEIAGISKEMEEMSRTINEFLSS